MLVFAAIMPHPPESIPGIGKPGSFGLIKKTLDAFEKLRIGLEKADPETIVIISPHAYSEEYTFVINSASELRGNLREIGSNKEYKYANDSKITDELNFLCLQKELMARLHPSLLDYGALIPLYHLTKNIRPKVVHLAFSMMSYEFHYRYGETLQKIIENSGRRVAIIASGNLSHRLTPDSPAGFYPKAKEFDKKVIRYLENNEISELMLLDKRNITKSAECGLRPIMILLGALHGKKYKFNLLSYEYPTGIGYLTARLL
ncbi:MAG TPA: AmmeMemoRadiSam system protein B [Candidatus Moranbacteria bacterium]|nr:AmmeMemoRadiSam system protein B [Candidatus Moranbacteria bacterium]